MIRWHVMEIDTRKQLCKYSLSSWLTKPASEFQNGICPSWSLWLHVNTFTAFACPVSWGELCLPSHECLNWIFELCPNHSPRSSKSAFGFRTRILSCFILFSLSTRSTLFDFTVSVLFLWLSERGKTLVQKKPTMYPEWKSTFDAHIYEGRVIQIVLMKAAEEPLSEVTVGVSVLAERCKKGNGKAEFWVRKINSLNLLTWLYFFQAERMPYAF